MTGKCKTLNDLEIEKMKININRERKYKLFVMCLLKR